MAVSGNLVLGQRVVYARGRLNGLFMSIFFIGGAVGSALGATLIGAALPLLALLYAASERRQTAPRTSADGGQQTA